jgi:hypothetical protein
MATKKVKSKFWIEDGDDAHFSDNPAVAKHHTKNHSKTIHKEGTSTVGGRKIIVKTITAKSVAKKPQTRKKVTRKRVGGK